MIFQTKNERIISIFENGMTKFHELPEQPSYYKLTNEPKGSGELKRHLALNPGIISHIPDIFTFFFLIATLTNSWNFYKSNI